MKNRYWAKMAGAGLMLFSSSAAVAQQFNAIDADCIDKRLKPFENCGEGVCAYSNTAVALGVIRDRTCFVKAYRATDVDKVVDARVEKLRSELKIELSKALEDGLKAGGQSAPAPALKAR